MNRNDIAQIKVGGTQVGIIGLKLVIEDMAAEYVDRQDQDIRKELVNRPGRRNYIPETARDKYEKAFLREFRKFTGKSFEEEDFKGFEIKVLGPGCAQCDRA